MRNLWRTCGLLLAALLLTAACAQAKPVSGKPSALPTTMPAPRPVPTLITQTPKSSPNTGLTLDASCGTVQLVKVTAPGMYQDPHYGAMVPVQHGADGVTLTVTLNCLPAGASVWAFDKNVDDTRYRQDDTNGQVGPIATTASFSFTDKPIGEPSDSNERIYIVFVLDANPDCDTQLHQVTNDGYLPDLPKQCGDQIALVVVNVKRY